MMRHLVLKALKVGDGPGPAYQVIRGLVQLALQQPAWADTGASGQLTCKLSGEAKTAYFKALNSSDGSANKLGEIILVEA